MAAEPTKTGFDSLYRTHYARIHRFVFRFVQDASLADELAQDVFLRAYQAWEGFRGEAPAGIWLLRIARNVCIDYLRSPRSHAGRTSPFEETEPPRREGRCASAALAGQGPPPNAEGATRRAQMSDCVQRFVIDLPETLRTPLILHDMEGFTNAEIAQTLGCSLEAAKMRLHRARAKLRGLMEQRCDLFYDERNVLSCLPIPPDRHEAAQRGLPAASRGPESGG